MAFTLRVTRSLRASKGEAIGTKTFFSLCVSDRSPVFVLQSVHSSKGGEPDPRLGSACCRGRCCGPMWLRGFCTFFGGPGTGGAAVARQLHGEAAIRLRK